MQINSKPNGFDGSRDVETYHWDRAVAWVTADAAMFIDIPVGSYELIFTIGWDQPDVHNACTINYAGGSFSLAYGNKTGGGYQTHTMFISPTSVGDIVLVGSPNQVANGILRPSATLRRIYR